MKKTGHEVGRESEKGKRASLTMIVQEFSKNILLEVVVALNSFIKFSKYHLRVHYLSQCSYTTLVLQMRDKQSGFDNSSQSAPEGDGAIAHEGEGCYMGAMIVREMVIPAHCWPCVARLSCVA